MDDQAADIFAGEATGYGYPLRGWVLQVQDLADEYRRRSGYTMWPMPLTEEQAREVDEWLEHAMTARATLHGSITELYEMGVSRLSNEATDEWGADCVHFALALSSIIDPTPFHDPGPTVYVDGVPF